MAVSEQVQMLLQAKDLITKKTAELLKLRQTLSVRPGLALVWVGNDPQTKAFIRVKQQKAKLLDCDFYLHHLDQGNFDQLAALMRGLNRKKEIHGIVLQLPLPNKADTQPLINLMNPEKDIDNLRSDSPFEAPTPSGILEILRHNKIDPGKQQTVILGAGRLVGGPLAKMFEARGWHYTQIPKRARDHAEEIRQHDLLISGTGVKHLVGPAMVHENMIVVDGSGIDVDIKVVEPLVEAITPSKGSVGPMTVCCLFENLLRAAEKASR